MLKDSALGVVSVLGVFSALGVVSALGDEYTERGGNAGTDGTIALRPPPPPLFCPPLLSSVIEESVARQIYLSTD